ncbi:beta-N-acetylglucosaminidase domain-containing protein, partial [Deinococcus pimensis]|uniref:beta-N-acetylglucosaminidase domain-containing protein n=1 Tax=Deinococcus pimensis TaxID=309888 RepID=UPI001B7FED1D
MLTELETDQSGASPFRFRGIIEGFYGRPWAWTERHSTLDFMAREGLNTYLYAPKNEPLHRNRWREPYLPEDWARFARLHEHGARLGIDVVFGLSPLEFHYGDPDDLRVLLEKLHAARAVGYRSFCLLLDDMPDTLRHEDDRRRFGALADAQAWLLRRLLPDVPGDLWFVPTEYHGTGTSAYLTRLGEASPPRVRMFWTGPQTVSRTIGASDLTGVNAALRRRVVLWDNYPVNDLDMRFRLHLGPYEGRAADLARACDGVLAAGGLQPHAHRIPLATFAAFLRAPDAYDPDAQ